MTDAIVLFNQALDKVESQIERKEKELVELTKKRNFITRQFNGWKERRKRL